MHANNRSSRDHIPRAVSAAHAMCEMCELGFQLTLAIAAASPICKMHALKVESALRKVGLNSLLTVL